MKVGIHNLNDLTKGDIVVVERYHTGPQLADYWYKRPWQVTNILNGKIATIATDVIVIGLNKNNTNKAITGNIKAITEKMLQYAKIYKLTDTKDLHDWINQQRYND